MNRISTLSLAAALLIPATAISQTSKLTLVPKDAVKNMVQFYVPHQLDLTATKPAVVSKIPAGFAEYKYGEIKFQGKSIAVLVATDKDGKRSLFVDSNGNGDL